LVSALRIKLKFALGAASQTCACDVDLMFKISKTFSLLSARSRCRVGLQKKKKGLLHGQHAITNE
jgi:hypothetical protein